MKSKHIVMSLVLGLLSTLISFSVFINALGDGNIMRILLATGGFVIFLSMLIMVVIVVVRSLKRGSYCDSI